MANVFKFELVPDGLQVTEYHSYDDFSNNINATDCGIYTKGSTVEWNGTQYIIKDGDDSVVFTPYEIVSFVGNRVFFYFQGPEAILEAIKGILASGVTANQSHNLPLTYGYFEENGYNLDYSSASIPTLNIIDYTEGANEIYAQNTLCKSINFYCYGVYGDVVVDGSYFLESVTMPTFFDGFYAYHLPNLKEVYLYDGYSLYPDNEIDFNTSALSQASVDRILQACVNGEYSYKNLYLNGGNNAIPSSEGFNNISILVSRGWNVYYND